MRTMLLDALNISKPSNDEVTNMIGCMIIVRTPGHRQDQAYVVSLEFLELDQDTQDSSYPSIIATERFVCRCFISPS
jgi:hypothetical protein